MSDKTESQGIATGAPDLDLDKLESEVRNYAACGYLRARVKNEDALALIELARRAQPAGAGEPEAWLYVCEAPGKRTVYASVDENDNHHWPLDQWKSVEKIPLVRAALTHPSVSASQPEQGDLTTAKCPVCAGHRGFACDECYGQGRIIVSRKDMAALTQQPSAAPSVQQAGAQAQAQPDLRAAIERGLEYRHIEDGTRAAFASAVAAVEREVVAALSASPSAPAAQAGEPVAEFERGIDYIMAAVCSYADTREESTLARIRRMISGTIAPNTAPVEAFAWAAFADNGNVIIWSRQRSQVEPVAAKYGKPIVPVIALQVIAAQTTTASASDELISEIRKLTQYKHCMSYNDNYFGEPAGLIKRVTYQLDRLIDRAPAPSRSAAPAEPEAATPDGVKQVVCDAVADALSGLYYCGRVWSAWGVGTMSEDDFLPANEDDDIIESVAEAAINAMVLASMCRAAPAGREDARDAEVERKAEEIYNAWPESARFPWVKRGNSNKQDEARSLARAALSTMQQSTEGGA